MDQKNKDNYNQEEPFDFNIYLTILSDVVADLEEFNNTFVFTQMCRETTKIFNKLGGILDKAFTDIHDKCNIVKRNYEMHKDYHNAMLPFIKLEIQMDIAKLNGENGSFLKNTDMDRYSQYESTARTVLRLMWFLDFVFHLYEGLQKNKSRSLGQVCQESYNTALSSHHPLHVVIGVKAGMLLVPSRERLFEILFQNKNYPQAYEKLEIAQIQVDLIRNRLWNYYKEEKITSLP